MTPWRWSFALLVVAPTLASCDRSDPTASASEEPLPLAVEVEDGALKATVAHSADAMGVADALIVDLIAEGPISYDATLPADAAFAPFEVVSRTPVERLALPGDRVATRVRLTVTSDRAGELELPALPFAFAPVPMSPMPAEDGAPSLAPSTGGPTTLTTPPVAIEVATLLEGDSDPAQFIGNKPVAERPDDRSRAALVIAVAVATLLLGAATTAGIVYARRRRTPPPTPAEWANAELDRLSAEGLAAQGDVESFFTKLTGIAREFIRRQLGIAAPMRTSDEFLRDLGSDPRLAPPQKAHLDQLLRFGDLVKFAREAADERTCANAVGVVRDLVRESATDSRSPIPDP